MLLRKDFCMWLVNTLQHQNLTYKEIQTRWMNSPLNNGKKEIPQRSFTRYCRYAESLFDIEIKCARTKGFRYVLSGDENDSPLKEIHQWLLSAHKITSLTERIKNNKNVVVEAPPTGYEHLNIIFDAIDNSQGLKIHYQSHHSNKPKDYIIAPSFVRLFKQRWYVIGEELKKKQPYTFALERIHDIELTQTKYFISDENSEMLNLKNYYEHCFGITRVGKPIRIQFRAYSPQNLYIQDVPIHSSQSILQKTAKYTDFEIYVRPTFDLIQELLSNREMLEILGPKNFRDEIKSTIQSMLNLYQD